MTATELSAVAGVVLSLVFSYIPGVKNWFDGLESGYKQAVMGGVLIVVTSAIFGLACYGVIVTVECTQAGALGLVMALIAALVGNQSVYLITKKGGTKQELSVLRAQLVMALRRIDRLQQ